MQRLFATSITTGKWTRLFRTCHRLDLRIFIMNIPVVPFWEQISNIVCVLVITYLFDEAWYKELVQFIILDIIVVFLGIESFVSETLILG